MSTMKHKMQEIADHYVNTPDEVDKISDHAKLVVRNFAERFFERASKEVEIRFVDETPYEYIKLDEVMADFNQGFLRVPTSGDDSIVFGKVNLKFRASHDYLHCVMRRDFGFEDEIDTFFFTCTLFDLMFPSLDSKVRDEVACIFRSEIVFQSAFKNVYGDTPKAIIEQKVILSYEDGR